MNWYKVCMVVPGTDGNAENGPCEPQWWDDMVQAEDEHTAIAAANAMARADWEASDDECPCGRGLGIRVSGLHRSSGGYRCGIHRLEKGTGRDARHLNKKENLQKAN